MSEPDFRSSVVDADPGVAAPASTDPAVEEAVDNGEQELVVEDLLVEEISIDGMCGVY